MDVTRPGCRHGDTPDEFSRTRHVDECAASAVGLERQADRVHAEPVAGRRLRRVVEHVPQVRPALRTPHLGADHAQGAVGDQLDPGRPPGARRSWASRSASRTWCRSGTARCCTPGTGRRPRASRRAAPRSTPAPCPPCAAQRTPGARAPTPTARRSSSRRTSSDSLQKRLHRVQPRSGPESSRRARGRPDLRTRDYRVSSAYSRRCGRSRATAPGGCTCPEPPDAAGR